MNKISWPVIQVGVEGVHSQVCIARCAKQQRNLDTIVSANAKSHLPGLGDDQLILPQPNHELCRISVPDRR